MTYLPPPNANCRSPRIQLADMTHVVLRLPDGRRSRGKLETVSLTGGLLRVNARSGVPHQVDVPDSDGTSIWRSRDVESYVHDPAAVPVLSLEKGDARRLRAAVQSSLKQNPGQNQAEQAWIE